MKTFKLPELPYAKEALKPFLTPETLDFHYGKHHRAYIDNMNRLLSEDAGKKWAANVTLEELVMKSEGGMFNQAGQSWNHSFYWFGLSPENQQLESNGLASAVNSTFGSVDAFKTQFIDKGMSVFGSGWVWLVKDGSRLEIVGTSNAENPMRQGKIPLLVCDVWEHAYYIDFRNERKKYLENFMQRINWRFVNDNFSRNTAANMTALM